MDRNNGNGADDGMDRNAVKPMDAKTHDTTPAADGGDEEARPMLAVACIAAICSGNDFVTARWALSVIIAFVAYGMLQQVAFNCQKTDGWTYVKSALAFGIAFYIVFALCVLIGAWFPAGLWQAWLLFTAVYAVILVAAILAGTYGDRGKHNRQGRQGAGRQGRRSALSDDGASSAVRRQASQAASVDDHGERA